MKDNHVLGRYTAPAAPVQGEEMKIGEHTALPWALLSGWPDKIVPVSEVHKSLGGSIHEAEDRKRYALVIASAESNRHTGFAHEIALDTQRANARLIVTAVNSHHAILAENKACYQRIDELETALKAIAWMDDFLCASVAKEMMNIARKALLEPFPAESGA